MVDGTESEARSGAEKVMEMLQHTVGEGIVILPMLASSSDSSCVFIFSASVAQTWLSWLRKHAKSLRLP